MFYKETEFQETKIGKLPRNWEVQELESVVKEAKSGFASGKRDEKGVLQLRMNSIRTDGTINVEGGVRVPAPPNVDEYILTKGDILFDNTNSVDLIGKTALFKGEFSNAVYSNHLTRLRVDNNQVIPEWITYVMIRKWKLGFFKAMCHRHVHQAGINNGDLLSIKVPIPPIAEQKEVSKVLGVVDCAIELADRIIAKTERLKRGLMQQLLTRGIGHTETKQTPIGTIPKTWKIAKIEEIAEIKGRVGWKGYKRSDFVEESEGAISLGANNITKDNRLSLEELTYVSWKKYEESPEIHVNFGDIIIAQRGSLGKVAIIDKKIGKATINPNVVLIKRIKVNPFYLYYALTSDVVQKQINAISSSTTVPLLTQEQIKSFVVPLADMQEQQKIAEILSNIDKKLELERREKLRLERIKQGLMALLLTGKIRIKVD